MQGAAEDREESVEASGSRESEPYAHLRFRLSSARQSRVEEGRSPPTVGLPLPTHSDAQRVTPVEPATSALLSTHHLAIIPPSSPVLIAHSPFSQSRRDCNPHRQIDAIGLKPLQTCPADHEVRINRPQNHSRSRIRIFSYHLDVRTRNDADRNHNHHGRSTAHHGRATSHVRYARGDRRPFRSPLQAARAHPARPATI